MDMTKIDLNAPAFGQGSQKVNQLEETSAETTQAEPEKTEEVKKEEEIVEPSEEEKRVTYSRFKNVHTRALEAERRAEEAEREANEWRMRAEQAYKPSPVESKESDIPSWWTELYGDSEASQKAWNIQSKANAEFQQRLIEEAQQKAIEAIENQQYQAERRTQENVSQIDTNLEQLEAYVGRELTEKEQLAVLNIVDDFTPKDDDGNYLGATIPFERAWEIYELKNQAQKAPKAQARDAVAAINGSQSQGDPSIEAERNKNFNPLDWNAWKKRL